MANEIDDDDDYNFDDVEQEIEEIESMGNDLYKLAMMTIQCEDALNEQKLLPFEVLTLKATLSGLRIAQALVSMSDLY